MLSRSEGGEYAAKMSDLLRDAGVIERRASDRRMEELDALAGSLVAVADQLDAAGFSEAAASLDAAMEAVAKHMPECPKGEGHCPGCSCGCAHCPCPSEKEASGIEPALVAKASAITLIRLADRFDALGTEDVASGIDSALDVLAAH